MLRFLTQSEETLKGLILSPVPGLWTKKYNDRILVIHPDKGTHLILEPPLAEFFNRLKSPVPYTHLIKNDQGIPPAIFISLMESLTEKGMLNLSGRNFEQKEKKGSSTAPPHQILFLDLDLHRLNDKIEETESRDIFIHIQGTSKELPEMMKKIRCKGEDRSKNISFVIHLPYGESFFADEPFITALFYIPQDSPADEKQFPHLSAKSHEGRSHKGVCLTLSKAELIVPWMEFLAKSQVSNIILKMSPSLYINKEPITRTIKKMEEFAHGSLDGIQILMNISSPDKTLLLNDINRFIHRILGFAYPFPCGKSPCGGEKQIQVITEGGESLSCLLNSPQEPFQHKDIEKIPRCSHCVWKKFCYGGCPVITYRKYGDFQREDPRCRYFQIMFEELLWKIHHTPILARKLGGLVR